MFSFSSFPVFYSYYVHSSDTFLTTQQLNNSSLGTGNQANMFTLSGQLKTFCILSKVASSEEQWIHKNWCYLGTLIDYYPENKLLCLPRHLVSFDSFSPAPVRLMEQTWFIDWLLWCQWDESHSQICLGAFKITWCYFLIALIKLL